MKNNRRGRRPKGHPVRDRRSDDSNASAGSSLLIRVRFCVLFFALIVVFSSLTSSRWAGSVLHDRLTVLIARLSASILGLFGDAWVSGHHLTFNGFPASVEGACDGVQPTYVYLAAVLAFPCRWRDKGWGILVGVPAIFLINFIRVTTMMLFGAYWPNLFEWTHLYGWQALVIILTMGVWIFWAELFVRPRDQATS